MTEQIQQPLSRAEVELQKIVNLFQSGEVTGLLARVAISGGKPSSAWSFGNQILMLLHGTEDARGFRQWQQVSRYVKKGARAFYILGPILHKKEIEDEVTHEKKTIHFLGGFKAIPVFAVEDTDGLPLEEYKPVDPPPLLDVAEKWGLKVKYDKLGRYAWGMTTSKGGDITLATEDWDVFFHELAHNAHAKFEELKGGQNPEQEAVAQLTAAVLTRVYGRNADANTYEYIAHYAGGKSPEQVGRLCLHVLAKVEKCLRLILGTGNGSREDASFGVIKWSTKYHWKSTTISTRRPRRRRR